MNAEEEKTRDLWFSQCREQYSSRSVKTHRHFWHTGDSKNILENYNGSPRSTTDVLFLGHLDLRLALDTAAYHCGAFKSLNLHLNNKSLIITARNVLIAHIVNARCFNPEEPIDLKYVWSIWYNAQFDHTTTKRFLNDLDQLLAGQLSSSVIVPSSQDFTVLCEIWNSWKSTVNNMNAETFARILAQRVQYISYPWFQLLATEKSTDPLLEDTVVSKLLMELGMKLNFSDGNTWKTRSFIGELTNYLKTGNCGPMTNKMVMWNPTLLQPYRSLWMVFGLSSPFECYLPFPYQLKSSDNLSNHKSGNFQLFHHCLAVLKDQMVHYRSRMKNITFSFHLGDCLQHSMLNPHWSNRFTVVHTSNLLDVVGLANLLSAVSNCLFKEDPYALIITNSSKWFNYKPTIAQYIEASLSCPLTLIPTIYGLRLVDHILLGSSVPTNLCKNTPVSTRLNWQRAPVTYSDNVKLEMSPDLIDCLKNIFNMCYFVSQGVGSSPVYNTIRCTPMTYSYIIESLKKRNCFLEFGDEYLLDPKISPRILLLTWRTQQLWMNGGEVLQCEMTSSFKLDSPDIRLLDRPVKLLLIPADQIRKFERLHREIVASDGLVNLPTPESLLQDCHYVENIQLTCSADATHETVYVSFLLDVHHGLNDSYYVYLLDALYSLPIFKLGRLSLFKKTITTNPFPFGTDSRPISSPTEEDALLVNCHELNDSYIIHIADPNVNWVSQFKAEFSYRNLHLSTHELVFQMLPDGKKHVIQVPWPFVTEDKDFCEIYQQMENNMYSVMVVLQKCLHNPWPVDDQAPYKWHMGGLQQWSEKYMGESSIVNHLVAQCDEPRNENFRDDKIPSSPLEEVRRIVAKIIHDRLYLRKVLFSIVDFRNPSKVPSLYLRAHLPLLRSPLDSPLCLVSAVDTDVAYHLIEEGHLTKYQFRQVSERIFGFSPDWNPLYYHSDEGLSLFRYTLRLNSTRMEPTGWQTKYFPQHEYSPWLATFISPLYAEYLTQLTESSKVSSTPKNSCANCFLLKDEMKQCSRCKLVVYCGINCQKADWSKHKLLCFNE